MEPSNSISEYIKNNLSSRIGIIDTGITQNLLLFHYTSTPETDIEKSIRGVITDTNYKVVMPSLPYTNDIVFTGTNDCLPFLTDGSDNTYFKGLEGSIIRLYNYNGMWSVSTTKKINAMDSKWGGDEPFEILFKNAIVSSCGIAYDTFLNSLSVNHQYVFLLNNIEQTRIVSYVTTDGPHVYLVAVFSGDDLMFADGTTKIGSLNIKTLEKLCEFPKAEELMGYNLQSQGVFVVSKKNDKIHLFKVITPQYYKVSQLRGNTFSIESRYLELRGESEKLKEFVQFFKAYDYKFADIEARISFLSSYFLERYNTRFYYGRYANVDKRFYPYFLGLRAYQKGNNMLTAGDVCQYFNDTHHFILERILKII